MARTSLPAALTLGLLGLVWPGPGWNAQVPVERPQVETDSGLVLSCEVFCSETKLRTANARLRWRGNPGRPEAAMVAGGKTQLQATAFSRGFEKGLYVALPVGGPLPARALAPAPEAQGARPLRAHQIQLIQTMPLREAAGGTAEMGAVVEDLEPGVSYTWRVVLEAGSAKAVSQEVMCQAPVCPADLVEKGKAPQGRPEP